MCRFRGRQMQNALRRDSVHTKCCIFNGTGGSEAGKSRSVARRSLSHTQHSPTLTHTGRFTKCCACHEICTWGFKKCFLPAKKSTHRGAQSAVPATKSAHGGSQSAPACADFVADAIQNALWRDIERTKCCIFNGTGGTEAGKSRSAERRVRDGLESFSDHSQNRPSIGIRVVSYFLK